MTDMSNLPSEADVIADIITHTGEIEFGDMGRLKRAFDWWLYTPRIHESRGVMTMERALARVNARLKVSISRRTADREKAAFGKFIEKHPWLIESDQLVETAKEFIDIFMNYLGDENRASNTKSQKVVKDAEVEAEEHLEEAEDDDQLTEPKPKPQVVDEDEELSDNASTVEVDARTEKLIAQLMDLSDVLEQTLKFKVRFYKRLSQSNLEAINMFSKHIREGASAILQAKVVDAN